LSIAVILFELLSNNFQDLKQLRFYLKDMFAAGTETTTSTIRWILFYLIKHPEIQQKVHCEIEEVLGELLTYYIAISCSISGLVSYCPTDFAILRKRHNRTVSSKFKDGL